MVVSGWVGGLAVATVSNLNLMLVEVDVGLGFDNFQTFVFKLWQEASLGSFVCWSEKSCKRIGTQPYYLEAFWKFQTRNLSCSSV